MPPTATNERAANVPPTPEVSAVGSSSSGTAGPQQAAPSETAATASTAVQAALTAAELFSSANATKTVNLQFNMGNADLSLRVQLLNGQVHATFSTDSAQLRSALANEWQSASASPGHASLNLAQPVFTSSGGTSLASGDEGSQQRAYEGRGDPSGPAPSASPARPAVAPSQPILVSGPVAAAGSQHLQTFA